MSKFNIGDIVEFDNLVFPDIYSYEVLSLEYENVIMGKEKIITLKRNDGYISTFLTRNLRVVQKKYKKHLLTDIFK